MKPITQTFREMLKLYIWPLLQKCGFKQKGYEFERSDKSCIESVRFGFETSTEKTGTFFFSVGVFYPEIERLLNFGVENVEAHTTIGCIISFLGPPLKYKNWHIAVGDEVAKIGVEVRQAMEEYGLPFMERLNSVPKLIKEFETDQILPVSPLERIRILAAAYYTQGNSQRALQILDAASRDFKKKSARIVFVQLRDYLSKEPK